MRYRVEFRHKKDHFWDFPAYRYVNAKNKKEAIKKFRKTPLAKKNHRNMVVEGASRDDTKLKKWTRIL
jgi:hypothetical protein